VEVSVGMDDDCGRCHECLKDKFVILFESVRVPVSTTRMVLCVKCGNKRCPRAQDHRFKCTNSNELGQVPEPDTACQ
jgi:hypothetical protein